MKIKALTTNEVPYIKFKWTKTYVYPKSFSDVTPNIVYFDLYVKEDKWVAPLEKK